MAATGRVLTMAQATPTVATPEPSSGHGGHAPDDSGVFPMPMVVGEVDHVANGFNPTDILTDFDGGTVSTLPSGQILREYTVTAFNKLVEIVPGLEISSLDLQRPHPRPPPFGPPKATGSGSSSSTAAITPTACTSTGFIQATWTACSMQRRA